MFNYVPIIHKQMSFLSNSGKFKLYTVLNGLIFPTPTQPRISFERSIQACQTISFYTEKKTSLSKIITYRRNIMFIPIYNCNIDIVCPARDWLT
jgi:hypothetical protein